MNPPYDIAAHRFRDVPQWLQDELRAYLTEGKRPGEFLFALLCNDFRAAFDANAHVSFVATRELTGILFEHFTQAWGSLADVHQWMEHEGLKGMLTFEPCALSIGPDKDYL